MYDGVGLPPPPKTLWCLWAKFWTNFRIQTLVLPEASRVRRKLQNSPDPHKDLARSSHTGCTLVTVERSVNLNTKRRSWTDAVFSFYTSQHNLATKSEISMSSLPTSRNPMGHLYVISQISDGQKTNKNWKKNLGRFCDLWLNFLSWNTLYLCCPKHGFCLCLLLSLWRKQWVSNFTNVSRWMYPWQTAFQSERFEWHFQLPISWKLRYQCGHREPETPEM